MSRTDFLARFTETEKLSAKRHAAAFLNQQTGQTPTDQNIRKILSKTGIVPQPEVMTLVRYYVMHWEEENG